jgi:hypothetical protein
MGGKGFALLLDAPALRLKIIRHRALQAGMRQIMQAEGLLRKIAARQLVGTLRSRLDARQLALNGEVDGLIIAGLEMQIVVIFDGA